MGYYLSIVDCIIVVLSIVFYGRKGREGKGEVRGREGKECNKERVRRVRKGREVGCWWWG